MTAGSRQSTASSGLEGVFIVVDKVGVKCIEKVGVVITGLLRGSVMDRNLGTSENVRELTLDFLSISTLCCSHTLVQIGYSRSKSFFVPRLVCSITCFQEHNVPLW